MKVMGALANAAVASFLVEAFQLYVGGDLIGIPFLKEVGESAGSLGRVAGATLVALAMGVSPVYAMLVGASVLKFGLLPGFIAGAIAGLMVMYGFNDPMKVTLCFLCIMVSGIIAGYIGSLLFKNYPIRTAEQIRGTGGKATESAA